MARQPHSSHKERVILRTDPRGVSLTLDIFFSTIFYETVVSSQLFFSLNVIFLIRPGYGGMSASQMTVMNVVCLAERMNASVSKHDDDHHPNFLVKKLTREAVVTRGAMKVWEKKTRKKYDNLFSRLTVLSMKSRTSGTYSRGATTSVTATAPAHLHTLLFLCLALWPLSCDDLA